MKISQAPNYQAPVRLQSNKQPQEQKPAGDSFKPSTRGSDFMEGVKRKAGAMSSVIAGTAIGAGVTALAAGALSPPLCWPAWPVSELDCIVAATSRAPLLRWAKCSADACTARADWPVD